MIDPRRVIEAIKLENILMVRAEAVLEDHGIKREPCFLEVCEDRKSITIGYLEPVTGPGGWPLNKKAPPWAGTVVETATFPVEVLASYITDEDLKIVEGTSNRCT